MDLQDDNYVKILYPFYSDLLDEETVETMWAVAVEKEKGLYKLDSIPFYAKSLASGDILLAEYDDTEKALTYRNTIEYSGNSTIQIVMLDKTVETEQIRQILRAFGCESEKFAEGYFVVNIPADTDYIPICKKLQDLQNQGIIQYAESCLSERHRNL